MKIFIFQKNKAIVTCLIILIIVIIIFSYLIIKFSKPATELVFNSVETNNFKEKIRNLTSGEEKIAYLTFDDGPNALITPKILDILKAEDVKATFFVIGKYVDEHPEIVKRAYDEGHYIANHSYDHNNDILYKNEESFINEIQKTDMAIAKAIGKENYITRVFRFPNGYMAPLHKEDKKKAVLWLQNIDYTYIDWNCLNNDSMKKYTSEQLLDNLKKSSKNKNTLVILMHDTKDVSNSSLVLQDSIKYLKSQGYEFKNFYELID